jgi:glutathione peroxidase-family protein
MKHFSGQIVTLALAFFTILLSCASKKENSPPLNPAREKAHNELFSPNPRIITERAHPTLSLNAKAPDFRLPGTDDRFYTLESFNDAAVLAVIFISNQCPTSQAYEDRIIELVDDYKDENVQIVGISPNSILTSTPEDLSYSELGDSFEEMKFRAREKNYNFPYLYDGDTQQATIRFGPTATPYAFVFDQNRKLKYSGRLDDSVLPGTSDSDDLRAAIDAVLLNVEILVPEKSVKGCPINWAWEIHRTEQANQSWENEPVFLNEINAEGISMLMQNSSGKLMLIDVWATWNKPSEPLYSELVDIYRTYRKRNLNFISVSIDSLQDRDRVLRFLNEKNSAGMNFIYSDSEFNFIPAGVIDPEWDGLLPFAALAEPGGNIIFKMNDVSDTLEMRRAIVEHQLMGRYR